MRKIIYQNPNAPLSYQHKEFLDLLKNKFPDYEEMGARSVSGSGSITEIFNDLFILLPEMGVGIAYSYKMKYKGEDIWDRSNVRIELIGKEEKVGEVEKIILGKA
ncbi:MAG: hypothetical protein AABY15_09720 [Nanoarchaeota archaeon]|mgnify:CR=1 FL=1